MRKIRIAGIQDAPALFAMNEEFNGAGETTLGWVRQAPEQPDGERHFVKPI